MQIIYTRQAVCLLSLFFFVQTMHAQNCWSPLGNGVGTISQTNNRLNGAGIMTNYNGKLIVSGLFDTVSGSAIKNIAAWDGVSWSSLGSVITVSQNNHPKISTMAVYNYRWPV
jgi:hypothetical protein